MHELSICQALITQIETIAAENHAQAVKNIRLQIGPLSGAEAPLIQSAYPMAAAGTVAENADLVIETMPIIVECDLCGAKTEAKANRLLCGECGDFHTKLISGDEMLLASLELDTLVH